MRARFLPPDYEQIPYQNCQQGTRLVSDYTEEFYRLDSQNNLSETKGLQVAWYIGGLQVVIQDLVTLHIVWILLEAVNLAMKIEMKLVRQPTRTQSFRQAVRPTKPHPPPS